MKNLNKMFFYISLFFFLCFTGCGCDDKKNNPLDSTENPPNVNDDKLVTVTVTNPLNKPGSFTIYDKSGTAVNESTLPAGKTTSIEVPKGRRWVAEVKTFFPTSRIAENNDQCTLSRNMKIAVPETEGSWSKYILSYAGNGYTSGTRIFMIQGGNGEKIIFPISMASYTGIVENDKFTMTFHHPIYPDEWAGTIKNLGPDQFGTGDKIIIEGLHYEGGLFRLESLWHGALEPF